MILSADTCKAEIKIIFIAINDHSTILAKYFEKVHFFCIRVDN